MKNIIFGLLAVVLFQTQAGFAATICQTNYKNTVSQCAQSLDLLSPNVRAGAQKACVQDAKIQKDLCENPNSNACLLNCQTQYNSQVANCEASYNPANCGGNTTCEQTVLAQRSDCINNSVDTLNTCNAACAQ